jgi:hypothetical protein
MSQIRLKQVPPQSLFGALFTSSVGIVMLLLIYAANIFAGYEIAAFRERPVGMGIGLAAVVPIIGPIILLSMPRPPPPAPTEEELAAAAAPVEAEPQRFTVPGMAPQPAAEPVSAAEPQEQIQIVAGGFSGAPPPKDSSQTQVFQRGQFMFNRRFFETKFPGFFGVVRRDADKDMLLVIKAHRGEYVAERISRISANELHVQIRTGHATEEVTIPFTEIQEIKFKHKDSP